MKNIKLDTVLLFVLLIPFIMMYRISPMDSPFWLFGLIFLGLLSYLCLDVCNLREKLKFKLKYLLLGFLIITSIGAASYSEILVRHQTSPLYNIHDIILQQESAIRFLLHGINPYEATYFGTPMEGWHYSDTEINPALYHFVMQPLYLIFAIPFYLLSTRTIGFFDGRMPLIFLFATLLFLAAKLVKDKQKKLEFIILLAFNPATLGYFLEGRADIFMYTFFFAALLFLFRKKNIWAGVFMAFAFAIKQSIWPILPFYLAYLYFQNKSFKKTANDLIPFTVVFLALVMPFFAWSPKAFLESTIYFLSGNTVHSYPISGYGFGMILNQAGIIKDVHSYFPFTIFQLIICIPLMVALIIWQKRNNTIPGLIIVYTIFLFVFWYFSRYFNNSHVGYLSLLLVTAYFWPQEKVSK